MRRFKVDEFSLIKWWRKRKRNEKEAHENILDDARISACDTHMQKWKQVVSVARVMSKEENMSTLAKNETIFFVVCDIAMAPAPFLMPLQVFLQYLHRNGCIEILNTFVWGAKDHSFIWQQRHQQQQRGRTRCGRSRNMREWFVCMRCARSLWVPPIAQSACPK